MFRLLEIRLLGNREPRRVSAAILRMRLTINQVARMVSRRRVVHCVLAAHAL